ncbi:hypothetical protein EBQ81_04565 [bacterium]|nr:hypothetical protein [bacterium]
MIFDYYKNIQLAQTIGAKELIKDIIKDFECILEIGTLHAGLSLFINDNKKPNTEFITFDINHSHIWQGKSTPEGGDKIKFAIVDCFSESAINIIKNKFKNYKTLLMCDGGNKNYEFNFYSQFMSSNSVIMLHDYIDDTLPEYWSGLAQIKNWKAPPESRYSAIKESVIKYGLYPYRYKELLEVFWGAYIKP